jgi:hypothetical protein
LFIDNVPHSIECGYVLICNVNFLPIDVNDYNRL